STNRASYSVKRPCRGNPSITPDHGRHKGENNACIIRIDPSCGYACFWGLFGCLAAFWRVFEVAAKVSNLDTSNGLLALGGLYRDNMQVSRLIRNTFCARIEVMILVCKWCEA